MGRLLKSRDSLMKCLGFVLLLGFISLGAIGGCSNTGGNQDGTQALTEDDFANDPNLFANPQEGVVVVFLEHPDSEEPDNDTGNVGNDAIPYRYTRALNHTFCFTDDNDASEHFMILQNTDGVEVIRALANGGCVTQLIEAGDYKIILSHGEHVEEIDPVFLIPIPEEEQVTKRYEFDQKEFRTANVFSSKMHRYIPEGLVKFFESISNVFTRRAIAQTEGTPSANLTTLINTNACQECNLMNVDLELANLAGADLIEADLTSAILAGADLADANLAEAILTDANLLGANLTGANLNEAILTDAILDLAILNGATLIEANLTGAILSAATLFEAILALADLTGADLTNANLTEANLNEAVLTDTILTGTILSFAIWIDGGTCDILSLGKCNIFNGNPTPCASLTESPASGNAIVCDLPSTDNSIDLVDVAHQLKAAGFSPTHDMIIWIQAWGANGSNGHDLGVGCSFISGCPGLGGLGGFTQTITTLENFVDSTLGFGTSTIFYYLGKLGTHDVEGGQGGTSTLVTFKNLENNSTSDLNLENDVLLIAGGGGGGGRDGALHDGFDGKDGGLVIAFGGFPGVGPGGNSDQCTGGSDSGAGIGGAAGGVSSDGCHSGGGSNGIGGTGGSYGEDFGAFRNNSWLNGAPKVGNNGAGGNAASNGQGGGGGGYGGGGGEGDLGDSLRGFGGCGGGSFANSKDNTLDISDTSAPTDFIFGPITGDGGVSIVFEF